MSFHETEESACSRRPLPWARPRCCAGRWEPPRPVPPRPTVTCANVGAVGECLDFRADPEYGVYTTGCNEGAYQTWTMATLPETATAMRQNAGSRLCLVARSGQPTMKPCLAGDQAALWTVHDLGPSTTGYQIINKATGTCLIAGSGAIHHVSLGACAGGGSRQWIVYS